MVIYLKYSVPLIVANAYLYEIHISVIIACQQFSFANNSSKFRPLKSFLKPHKTDEIAEL
jgi:hypothetical protein